MEINTLKTKNNFHNYITIKQADNTSPIELLLCGNDGSQLTNLNTTCTVTLLDTVDNQIRQKSTETIVGGLLKFKVKNTLKANNHNLEVTLSDGSKYPSDGDFTILVSKSHTDRELEIINTMTYDDAVKKLAENVVTDFVEEKFYKMSSEGQDMVEVIEARGEFPNLNERIKYKEDLDAELKRVSGANAKEPLYIPTDYPYNDHVVHPRVIKDDSAKYGYKWIMAFTPYSYMNDTQENPSVVVSDDGIEWVIPKGLKNPIVKTTSPGSIHLSDVDIFDNGTALELWYRESDKKARQSRILRMTSTDCVNWSSPQVIFDYGTGGYGYGASSVVLKSGVYELYYNRYLSFYREGYIVRKGNPSTGWSAEVPITFDYPPMWKGYYAWHIEVNYIDGKYICLNHAVKEGFDGGKLFYFESTDGVNFTNCKLLIAPSENGFDSSFLYKSSLVKNGNKWWIFYSGFTKDKENHVGLSIGENFDNLSGYYAKKINGGVDAGSIVFNTSSTYKYPEKSLSFNQVSHRAKIKSNGAEVDLPRFIKFTLETNFNDYVVGYQTVNNHVVGVEPISYGLKINLKNLPNTIKPTYIINYLGSTPPVYHNGKTFNYHYLREVAADSSYMIIGLKDMTTGAHIKLNELNAGSIEITLLF